MSTERCEITVGILDAKDKVIACLTLEKEVGGTTSMVYEGDLGKLAHRLRLALVDIDNKLKKRV